MHKIKREILSDEKTLAVAKKSFVKTINWLNKADEAQLQQYLGKLEQKTPNVKQKLDVDGDNQLSGAEIAIFLAENNIPIIHDLTHNICDEVNVEDISLDLFATHSDNNGLQKPAAQEQLNNIINNENLNLGQAIHDKIEQNLTSKTIFPRFISKALMPNLDESGIKNANMIGEFLKKYSFDEIELPEGEELCSAIKNHNNHTPNHEYTFGK